MRKKNQILHEESDVLSQLREIRQQTQPNHRA
jgi:hypothetical protein